MTNYSTPTHVNAPIDVETSPTMDADDIRALLSHLVATAEDGARGFETAADIVDDPSVAATFRKLGAERKEIAQDLRTHADAKYGELIFDEGTVKGAIHRGWMRLKDIAAGADPHAVIAAAEEGEDYAVEQWVEALEQPLPQDLETKIRYQYTRIKEAHDQVRSLEVATG